MTAPAAPYFAPIGSVNDRVWMEFALCRDKNSLFFEPPGERPQTRRKREAKAIKLCLQCPVQQSCREAGRRNRETGIWGGESDEERALAGYTPRGLARRSVDDARRAAGNVAVAIRS